MALLPVPADHIATVVTTLEMRVRPPLRPVPVSRFRLERWAEPDLGCYRTLFRRVGEPWLWFSRLAMTDQTLAGIIHDPRIEVHAVVDPAGIEIGLLELNLRHAGECELSYVGLVPELAGQGHGRWLMAEALARAWRPGVTRVWVHTCTLDHAHALRFYLAQGFVAIYRTLETFIDPRVAGLLPADAAPQVPVLARLAIADSAR